MQQLLDEQTAQIAILKESQVLAIKQEEDLERMQHDLNDANNLGLSAQRQVDEAHLEIRKLKEWNSKAKDHHESELSQILKEANELKERVESLTKKVAELEEVNAGYVATLERNESYLKIEQAPGVCEIQMTEIHEYQQKSDELVEIVWFSLLPIW